ncbi:MAG: hypothetical protein ACXWP4_25185, partial [Polyangiales bacterium]
MGTIVARTLVARTLVASRRRTIATTFRTTLRTTLFLDAFAHDGHAIARIGLGRGLFEVIGDGGGDLDDGVVARDRDGTDLA